MARWTDDPRGRPCSCLPGVWRPTGGACDLRSRVMPAQPSPSGSAPRTPRVSGQAAPQPAAFLSPLRASPRNLNSRLFVPSWGASQEDAERAGARVLALDRPGYGASSPHPGRRYPHFAADVDALASALDLSRFACVGYSSGGPHALAVRPLGSTLPLQHRPRGRRPRRRLARS